MEKHAKGFTLIELLVVIGIVAVLSVVVILTLNPAELLKQARDSTRISDLGTLKTALALWLTDVATTTANAIGNPGACYIHSTTATSGVCTSGVIVGTRFATSTAGFSASTTNAASNSWIPVNFTLISAGSPITVVPKDPAGDTSAVFFYGYKPTATLEYELNANMESTKFGKGGSSDVESNSADGGNNNDIFEAGTDPGLDL